MSSDLAIRFDGIGKTYRIGAGGATNLRETIMGRVRHPLRPSTHLQEFTALSGISFEVAQGEVVGVIGVNGAGKSTLFKILSRVTQPDTGTLDIWGRVGSLLEVGTGFHPELTGRENVFLNGAILGMRRVEIAKKFDDIVDFSGVSRFIDTPVKRFSSGMYVRLAFAVAAHLDAGILVLDEVLAVGDAAFQSKCLEKIESLAAEDGRTALFVSHNMATVRRLCHRVILLDHGRLSFDGETHGGISRFLDLMNPSRSDAPAGEWDLTKRTNHVAPHDLWFRRLTLRGDNGEAQGLFESAAGLHLTFEVAHHNELPQGFLGCRIRSSADHSIASFGVALNMADDVESLVTLHIPRLNLAPGRYTVDTGIQSYDQGHLLDEVTRAATFDVFVPGIDEETWAHSRGDGTTVLEATWETMANSSDDELPA